MKSQALIAVDGLLARGKSALCEALIRTLPGAHVRVDEYLIRQQGSYVASRRLDEVLEAIQRELAGHRVVLVGAVCSRQVMKQLKMAPDAIIYVARLDSRDEWVDGELFTDGMNENEAITEEERLAGAMGEEHPGLVREVTRYHLEFRPRKGVDLTYVH